ncbi:glycosyltransferase [Demequina maris]|uniref:glycosyltransferase n=1 Tax=Demequina maris TaxID=1638982 RepID=UPI000785EC9B|nr:glycosyltransferase [Demequina maris]
MPKVSVVTGYYNRADVLERTIRSILAQTFEDFELLVFDDASTDDTAARLEQLEEELADPRFRYLVHAQNKGFVAGLRDAIAQTTGEYIAIQGSGDVSLPTRLEAQARLLDERPEVGAVGGWYYNVVESTGVGRLRQLDADDATFEDLLRTNYYSHGEVMIRRSVHDQVGGYRVAFRNGQDLDLWLRISKVARLATVPEVVYHRYVQFDGVSYAPNKLAVQARYILLARRIAVSDDIEAQRLLTRLREDGPLDLVPRETPELQKMVASAALRSVIWGASDDARAIARTQLDPSPRRAVVVTAAWLLGTPLGAPVRAAVRRALDVKKAPVAPVAVSA